MRLFKITNKKKNFLKKTHYYKNKNKFTKIKKKHYYRKIFYLLYKIKYNKRYLNLLQI